MPYFNLNIKHFEDPSTRNGERISHVCEWLDQEEPRAPIFYGKSTIASILDGSAGLEPKLQGEARDFCELGRNSKAWDETIIVTIDEGWLWIYKPSGKITGKNDRRYPMELVKSFKVEILKKLKIRDVPLVLASMKANPNFSRSTFREISADKYQGNIAAIATLCNNGVPNKIDRLDCLSSIEFETLVAKLFEEAGCFVPAYKGGFMKDIDLIAANDTRTDIDLGGLVIPSRKNISIQVKLRTDKHQEQKADFLITGSITGSSCPQNCFDRKWILEILKKHTKTNDWLKRSTQWANKFVNS